MKIGFPDSLACHILSGRCEVGPEALIIQWMIEEDVLLKATLPDGNITRNKS